MRTIGGPSPATHALTETPSTTTRRSSRPRMAADGSGLTAASAGAMLRLVLGAPAAVGTPPEGHPFPHAPRGGRGGGGPLAWRDGAWHERPWSDVYERVELISRGLLDLGVEPGDRISILSNSREEWTWFDYAALCTGATVVPIYQTNSPVECEYILRDAQVRL